MIDPNRAYTATEILELTRGQPRKVLKRYRNGEVLVLAYVSPNGVEWKIRCRPEHL